MTAAAIPGGDPLRDRLAAALAPAYTVDGELGRGGMSVVYRARDVRLRRDVAIKILPPELAFVANVRERFMREAQTAAQLAHPNIVPIYGVEEKDTLVWIVMALIDGETLGDRLAREGTLSAPETERILGSVADALTYAHSRGVIHRDIKPDNILLERNSLRVLVTDFGIARAVEGDGRLTLTGVAVGTPTYMSPEQAMGDGEIDGRSDLYSLGIVGYQLLAGAPPFSASSTPALLLKQVSEPLPPLATRAPAAPRALVAAIERALAKKPGDRWPAVTQFAEALHGRGSSSHVAMPSPPAIGVPAMAAPWRAAGASSTHSASRQTSPPHTPPTEKAWEKLRPRSVSPRPPVPLVGANAVPAWVYGANLHAPNLDHSATQFRRQFTRTVATLAFLGIINALTSPHFAWVLFPAFGMLLTLNAKWRPLGDAGLSFSDVVRNRGAARNAGVEGTVPAQLFSNSLAGRVRRFTRRVKLAAVALGVAAVSVTIGTTFHVEPLIAPFIGGGVIGIAALIGAARAARPLRQLGFGYRALFDGSWRDSETARAPGTAFRLREEEVSQLAPPDVVMSMHGERLRLAVDDRTAIRQQMTRLDGGERSILPDVLPVANSLVSRVVELSGALHQLDRDMGSATDGSLDARIAEMRGRAVLESDRTLALLVRQRQSLTELEDRRSLLHSQLDGASIALQNLRLDVLRLGSLGLESPAVHAVGQATEQARALSRDLAYLLEGAREVDRI